MAKRQTQTRSQRRTATGGRPTAARKSSAGGRARAGAGRTKTRGRISGRAGTGLAAAPRTRSPGSQARRNRARRTAARTADRPDLVRRPTGQMSEQEKRRTAAARPIRRPTGGGRGRQDRTPTKPAAREPQRRIDQETTTPQNIDKELYQRTSDYRQQKRKEEDVFAPSIQKAHLWLKEVMDEIGTDDRHRAHTALKSVLHTLRDRLTVEEAVDLSAQLPILIRGIYFEGWKPAGKPIKYSKEEFISTVRGYFQNLSGINHTEIIRAVFRVLRRNIPEGEINQIIGTLPEDFSELLIQEELVP